MENNAYSAQQAARPEYLVVSQWLLAFRVVVSDFAKQELMSCIMREIEEAERRAEAMRGEVVELTARVNNQAAMITGRHQYVGQDFEFRIKKLTDRAEQAEARALHFERKLNEQYNVCDEAIRQRMEAEAREAAMRVVADRYRWMRKNVSADMQWYLLDKIVNSPDDFDAAIDAAQKEKP